MASTEQQIELLAQKAIRRIQREGQFVSRAALVRIHARAVRAAQDRLDDTSRAATAHCRLYARINELMGVA